MHYSLIIHNIKFHLKPIKMKRFLIDYIEHPEADEQGVNNKPGPVITLSRECGCSSNRIAIKLSKILTGYSYLSESKKNVEWKWYNKEIFDEAAKELDRSPDQIKEVFLKEARASIHEISTAFTTERAYDVDEQEVIDHIVGLIRKIALKGNCIIVGRAANLLVKDIPNSLSVKLHAPLEWRIQRIMKISNLNYADARDYVLEVDRQRNLLVEHVAGRPLINTDYDVVFNYGTLPDDLIVDAIVNMLKSKKII